MTQIDKIAGQFGTVRAGQDGARIISLGEGYEWILGAVDTGKGVTYNIKPSPDYLGTLHFDNDEAVGMTESQLIETLRRLRQEVANTVQTSRRSSRSSIL